MAVAEDPEIIKLVKLAIEENLADFVLIGNLEKIKKLMKNENLSGSMEIVDSLDHKSAAEYAVKMVRDGEVEAIMKGMLHTSTFLKAVLDKEKGLNKGKVVSQISVYDKPFGEGLQLLTDCAMAIEPTLEEKKGIIENSVELAIKLGCSFPKVALLSAVEVVNPAIKDTVDAAILSKMCDRGQIRNCIVDGPFALDNAISPEAAIQKKISGEVAGNADVLVVPNLQVGNVLTKSLTLFSKKEVAAAVMGASAPIIMTSRTDSKKNKLLSIALAVYISEQV
nr:bifunctional enoyl-CoA hydratase/phosphate acetyltransferase [Fusibacter ferrireducens]